jgi:hypothetical protein
MVSWVGLVKILVAVGTVVLILWAAYTNTLCLGVIVFGLGLLLLLAGIRYIEHEFSPERS